MFHSEAKIIKDYAWLEANLGQLVPMEIVVRVPKADQCPSNDELRAAAGRAGQPTTRRRRAKPRSSKTLHEAQFQLPFLERMELAARVQNADRGGIRPGGRDVVGRAISAATFVRPLPEAGRQHARPVSTRSHAPAAGWRPTATTSCTATTCGSTRTIRRSCGASASASARPRASITARSSASCSRPSSRSIAAQHQREGDSAADRRSAASKRAGDEPLSGSRVLLVGMPASAGRSKATSTRRSRGRRRRAAGQLQRPSISTGSSPARSRDLLTNSRLQLDTARAADGQPAAGDLRASLAAYDCVVLVGDMPGLRPGERPASARPLVIDARDHTFAPGTAQQTAWQRQPARASRPFIRASCRSSIRPSGCCSTA